MFLVNKMSFHASHGVVQWIILFMGTCVRLHACIGRSVDMHWSDIVQHIKMLYGSGYQSTMCNLNFLSFGWQKFIQYITFSYWRGYWFFTSFQMLVHNNKMMASFMKIIVKWRKYYQMKYNEIQNILHRKQNIHYWYLLHLYHWYIIFVLNKEIINYRK